LSNLRDLALINRAIEIDESQLERRGTRGIILTKLARWEIAIPDLEAALNVNPQHVDCAHESNELSLGWQRHG
jgi:hypothetical protein